VITTARTLLGFSILGCMLACSESRHPELAAMEKAVRAEIGSPGKPLVGYLRDSTALLIDFDATVLPDTQAATFVRMARAVALAAVRHYPNAAALESVMVSAGEPIGSRSYRVLRQRIFTAAELR
jgi:hypothetical protein